MRIGILTTFYDFNKAYSLCSVVEAQLIALVKYGYNPVLFVHDNFKGDVPKGVEIRKIVPRFKLIDYSANQPVAKDFFEQVKKIKEALEQNLQDIDVAFTHDWIFQGWFLPYNVAMREADLKCKWLHWIHSAPSPRPAVQYPHDCRYKMMPNSKLIYMNNYDVIRLAEMYDGWADDIRVVYNPLDVRSFTEYHPLTKGLIEKYKLLEADIIDIYPISMTRAVGGKQPDKIIWLLSKLKKLGKSVRFIVCNAHSTAEKEKTLVKKYLEYAKECGLDEGDVIFTSLYENPEPNEFYLLKCPNCEYTYGQEQNGQVSYKYDKETFICDKCKKEITRSQFRKIDRSPNPRFPYESGVPNEVIRQLFQISNLFVFPTMSENCPLILLEAAQGKNLLVLNKSFEPLREFFGENALYFEFGSLIEKVNYQDDEKYYEDMAKIIIAELKNNKPLNAFNNLKQKFNIDWIFRNQLEPLLFENQCQSLKKKK